MHIAPTIGRQVWYHNDSTMQVFSLSELPFAATVVHVNSDETVNLVALDHLGNPHRVANCVLVQDPDDKQPTPYCTWMPYQKAQAAIAATAESAAKKAGAK